MLTLCVVYGLKHHKSHLTVIKRSKNHCFGSLGNMKLLPTMLLSFFLWKKCFALYWSRSPRENFHRAGQHPMILDKKYILHTWSWNMTTLILYIIYKSKDKHRIYFHNSSSSFHTMERKILCYVWYDRNYIKSIEYDWSNVNNYFHMLSP